KLLPTDHQAPSVVLERPLAGDLTLTDWHQAVLDRNLTAGKLNVTLVLYSDDGVAIARYQLANAFPTKLELVAGGSTCGSQHVNGEAAVVAHARHRTP